MEQISCKPRDQQIILFSRDIGTRHMRVAETHLQIFTSGFISFSQFFPPIGIKSSRTRAPALIQAQYILGRAPIVCTGTQITFDAVHMLSQ